MHPDKNIIGRRKFLGGLSATAVSGLLLQSMVPWQTVSAQTNAKINLPGRASEYLFAPGLVYMNSGTVGPCRRNTLAAIHRQWEELEALPVQFYGNRNAASLAEKTRTIAARFLGCDLNEMVITMSTTDGMNAIAQGLRLKAGDRILTTDQEHEGGLLCWKYFAKYYGAIVDSIVIPPGENNPETILNKINDAITPETKVISISHIFSSTGMQLPIPAIAALARSKGILSIVDGAQAPGAIQVNVKELGCHAYATSGHKWLMGPKGTGLLYLSEEVQDRIRPIQFETSYNTYNNSNGLRNLPCILALGNAIEYIESKGIPQIEAHNMSLRNRLLEQLNKIGALKLMSPEPGPLATPLLTYRLEDKVNNISFSNRLLEKHRISIRATHKQWFNGIRFSLHLFNTEQEVDFVAGVVREELA